MISQKANDAIMEKFINCVKSALTTGQGHLVNAKDFHEYLNSITQDWISVEDEREGWITRVPSVVLSLVGASKEWAYYHNKTGGKYFTSAHEEALFKNKVKKRWLDAVEEYLDWLEQKDWNKKKPPIHCRQKMQKIYGSPHVIWKTPGFTRPRPRPEKKENK